MEEKGHLNQSTMCHKEGKKIKGKTQRRTRKKKSNLLVGDFFRKIRFLIYGVHYSEGKTNSVIIDYIRAALKATQEIDREMEKERERTFMFVSECCSNADVFLFFFF